MAVDKAGASMQGGDLPGRDAVGDVVLPGEATTAGWRSQWQRVRSQVIPVLSLLGFALLWEVVSRSPLVDASLLPPPSQVVRRMMDLAGPGIGTRPGYLLIWHTLSTLGLLLGGFFLSAVVCTVVGVLMGINRTIYEWLNPIVAFFMPIPSFTLVFVFILWLGLGRETVIATVIIGSCFPILYNAAAGVRSGEQKMIWAAQIMGCSRFQVFWKVLIPGSLSYIITGQKLALGRAWRAVIGAEMFASTNYGLGFMLRDASNFLDTEAMFAAIITIGLTGLVLESVMFRFIERRTIERWGMVGAKTI